MTDTAPQITEQQTEPASFDLRRVYLKDASVEMPNAPALFLEQEQPKLNIEIAVEVSNLGNNAYETIVNATITATMNDKTAFLIQGKQAGIFEIVNVPADQLEKILNIVCPSMVFPYLRTNITDLMTRATLPPLYLAEMNFEALYQQQQQNASTTQQ